MTPIPPNVGAALDLMRIDRLVLDDVMPRVNPDRVRLRVAPRWFHFFWAKGIAAVTTPFGVFIHPDIAARIGPGGPDRRIGLLLVHELMHVEQLARLGIVAHTVQYLADYMRGRRRRLGHWKAYRAVRLEAEARAASALVKHRLDGPTPQ